MPPYFIVFSKIGVYNTCFEDGEVDISTVADLSYVEFFFYTLAGKKEKRVGRKINNIIITDKEKLINPKGKVNLSLDF